MSNLVARIENYIKSYVVLADPHYSLPIALWIIGTFCYPEFDAFGYLVITSMTKRSGKTRLAEMISFCCSNPRQFAAMTGPTMFRVIEAEKPTIIFDEAEQLSSEAASTMRSVLNVGYRKGATIPRSFGAVGVKDFDTYCPKIFILIGDVYDTLRDRAIIITMQRAKPPKRFTFDAAKSEGSELREAISIATRKQLGAIADIFTTHEGLPYLQDRDEEIWVSLFTLCQIFAPERLADLERAAADMAAEKTGEARRYVDLKEEAEAGALNGEYRERLLMDLYGLFLDGSKVISTQEALDRLKAIPTAPWRKFRGQGLDAHDLSNLLNTLDVRPVVVRIGSGRKNSKTARGYKFADVERAVLKIR